MSRRLLAQALAVALLLPVAGTAFADDSAPPELPRVGCTHDIVDIAGDAAPQYVSPGLTSSVFVSEPQVDILGLHARVTADQLQLLVALGQVPDTVSIAPWESAYRYLVTFKLDGHSLSYGAEFANPSQPLQPVGGSQGPLSDTWPQFTNNGTRVTDSGSAARFIAADPATHEPAFLLFTTPRAALEKMVGATLAPTDQLTDLLAVTQDFLGPEEVDVDSTDVPSAQAVKAVGDDYCFGLAPTSLSDLTVPSVQYGDELTLDATLKGEHDEALPGQPVQFSADTGPLGAATTDDDGIAEASLPTTLLAGSYPIAATFAGDATHRPSTASGTLVVLPETVVVGALQVAKPTAKTRTATATVLDDDKTPVAGQKLQWWVNGKQVATATTDSKGKAVYRALKPGQTVQARFPAVKGMYAAGVSKPVKA